MDNLTSTGGLYWVYIGKPDEEAHRYRGAVHRFGDPRSQTYYTGLSQQPGSRAVRLGGGSSAPQQSRPDAEQLKFIPAGTPMVIPNVPGFAPPLPAPESVLERDDPRTGLRLITGRGGRVIAALPRAGQVFKADAATGGGVDDPSSSRVQFVDSQATTPPATSPVVPVTTPVPPVQVVEAVPEPAVASPPAAADSGVIKTVVDRAAQRASKIGGLRETQMSSASTPTSSPGPSADVDTIAADIGRLQLTTGEVADLVQEMGLPPEVQEAVKEKVDDDCERPPGAEVTPLEREFNVRLPEQIFEIVPKVDRSVQELEVLRVLQTRTGSRLSPLEVMVKEAVEGLATADGSRDSEKVAIVVGDRINLGSGKNDLLRKSRNFPLHNAVKKILADISGKKKGPR